MNCFKCQTPLPDGAKFCFSCGADVSGETAERTQPVDADPELREKLQTELGGDFVIERELGRGGMAVVFLARDVHLGRQVAVKLLPPELTFGTSAGLVDRFKRDARTAATLDHPHIIPIHRVSTSGKLFWYVMKYLEGEALDDMLKRERQLSFDRTADILEQGAEALAYAHRKNVVHRDIKPANVMLDESGWVTVTDFGIAKALDTSSLTGSGSMIGTPYYMSPEQCSGKKVTGASDQYSLGVTAYQMVSGHLPFTGETVVDIIRKHCMDPVPPLAVLRPNTPPALVAVIERALAKSPEDRFASVTEFASAFARAASAPAGEAAERTADAPAKRERPSETALVSPVPGAVAQPPPLVVQRPSPARWPLLTALGAGGAALAVGVVIWAPWGRAGPSPQRPRAEGRPPVLPAATESLPAAQAKAESAASRPTTATAPVASAVLVLRGLPRGASATLDGQRARGTRLPLSAGSRHTVRVAAPGFEQWADTLTARAGDTVVRTVRLRSLTRQAAARAPAQPVAPQANQTQPPSVQPPAPQNEAQAKQAQPAAPQPVAAAPTPQPPAPAAPGTAFITVGSRPLSTVTINGRPVPNPVARFEVPAGVVRLHFVVTDTSGIWSVDTSVTVAPGEARNLGRVPLVRRR